MEKLFDILLSYESILLSSRPGMGNTVLLVNAVEAYLKRIKGKKVLIFAGIKKQPSGVVSTDCYKSRFKALACGEELWRLINVAKYEEASEQDNLFENRIVCEYRSVFDTEHIVNKTCEYKDVGLVIIDAPLLNFRNSKKSEDIDNMAFIARWFSEHKIKLVLATHLKSSVERRMWRVPKPCDFTEENKCFQATVSLFRGEYFVFENSLKSRIKMGIIKCFRNIRYKRRDGMREEVRIYPQGSKRPQIVNVQFDFAHQKITELNN